MEYFVGVDVGGMGRMWMWMGGWVGGRDRLRCALELWKLC